MTASNIDASGLTGSAGLRMTSAATTTTVTGSANADVVTLGAGMASIALGDGDDVLSAGRPLDGDTLNGGDGRDTLILGAAVQSAAVANVSGFEVLSLAAAVSQDLQQFGADQAFDVVRIDNGGANEISGASASLLALGLTVSAIESVSFSRLADTPADALTLLTLGAGSSDRVTEVGTLTVNGEERLVIDTGAAVVSSEQTYTSSLAINTLNAAAATTISVAGAGDVSLRMADQGEADALRSFDASAALGAVTFDASLLSADLTITGGRGVDTYTLGQGVHTIIEAGSAASVAENRVVDIDVINGFVVGRDTLGMSGTLYQSRGIYMDGAFTAQAEGDSVLIFASGDDATLQSGEFALVLVGVGGTGLLDLDGPAA